MILKNQLHWSGDKQEEFILISIVYSTSIFCKFEKKLFQ